MQASINSTENRTNGRLTFEVDEAGYSESGQRTFQQIDYIDGTGSIIDWSFQYTKLEIGVSGIELSHDNFAILKGMQRDNDYSFVFNYNITTYPVIITEITKVLEKGNSVLAAMRLTVSDTPPDRDWETNE